MTDTGVEPYDSSSEYNSKENAARPYDIDFEGDTYIKLNNNELFDEIFGKGNPSLEELYSAIDGNLSLPKEYKVFLKNYFKELTDYYPDLELRVFEYNLKNLKVELLTEYEIHDKMGGATSASYDYENNIIILKDNIDYENDIWDLICLRHEVAHMRNHFRIEKGDYTYVYRFWIFHGTEGSVGSVADEAMTVLFSTEPYYDDYIKAGQNNMGYPLATNEMRVIMESIDYSPADSVSHNIYFLEDRMNDVMGEITDSHIIIKTIDRQQTENVKQVIQPDDPEYTQLFEYIANIYIKKNIEPGMSYDEIQDQRDVLKNKLLDGVHNPEYVYTDVIDSVFDKYCEEH